MTTTVRETLALESFKGFHVLAGFGGLDREISTTTFIEAPDSWKWIRGGECVLTLAYAFQTEEQLLALVRELIERQATCIGIKTERYIKQVPQSVLDLADQHKFPIIDPNIPAGTVIVTPGCCMASYDHFVLHVTGKGCHGSTPEKGVDPIVVVSNIVLALEEIVAREVPSTKAAVVTIGRIHGGIAYNAIPGEVEIEGTTRALEEEVRQYLGKRIGEIAAGIARSYRAECKYEMIWGAAPVVNDDEMARLAAGAAVKVLGEDGVITSVPAPNMGGEDFAFYLRERPGAFMFLSSSNREKHTDGPHHNPRFDVDEDVFWKGSAVFVSIVEDYLGR